MYRLMHICLYIYIHIKTHIHTLMHTWLHKYIHNIVHIPDVDIYTVRQTFILIGLQAYIHNLNIYDFPNCWNLHICCVSYCNLSNNQVGPHKCITLCSRFLTVCNGHTHFQSAPPLYAPSFNEGASSG